VSPNQSGFFFFFVFFFLSWNAPSVSLPKDGSAPTLASDYPAASAADGAVIPDRKIGQTVTWLAVQMAR
jgi:hypothetical protein